MKLDLTPAWNTMRSMVGTFLASLPRLAMAVVVFLLFFGFSRLTVSLLTRVLTRRGCSLYVCRVIGKLMHLVLVTIGLLVSLAVALPSFKTSDIVQVLGIGSIAVGFAFRDVLQNFLAGIILLLSEPFRIGDQVEFGGQSGTVEDIQIRATILRGEDARRVVIPNTNLFTNPVIVHNVREGPRGAVRATSSGASAPPAR